MIQFQSSEADAVIDAYAETADPLLFKRARTWWTIIGLLLMAIGNGMFVEQSKHEDIAAVRLNSDSSGILLVFTLAFLAICSGLLVNRIRPILKMIIRQKTILAFLVLAFVSTAWSEVPLLTLRKAVFLLFAVALASLFAQYYLPVDQNRVLVSVGIISGLLSLAWVILIPRYGISELGEWKGIFGQKNFLGSTIFFLFAGLPFSPVSSLRSFAVLILRAAFPLVFIVMSQSRTPWIMTCVLILVRIVGPLITKMRRESIPFLLYSVVSGVSMLVVGLLVILPLMGRDLSLTGRTHEWEIILPFAYRHPWLGYGYQGFWTGPTGDSGKVDKILGAALNVSDSGYLDVMLQFGLVGLATLLGMLAVCARDLLKVLTRARRVPLYVFWYLGIIVATFVGSITEGMFWMPTRINPFILVLAYTGMRMLSDEAALSSGSHKSASGLSREVS